MVSGAQQHVLILLGIWTIHPLGEIMLPNKKKWWHDLPPPQGEEPILLLYLPWNLLHHGDLAPYRRKWLLEHFADVLDVFESSGIPVHMSYQRIDVDALQVVSDFDPERLQRLPLLSSPFSHALCGLIGDDYNEHIDWQIEHGVDGNVGGPNGEMGYFFPEFDIPANPSLYFRHDPMSFMLSVGAFATLYSECAVGDRADNNVMKYDAIRLGRQTVVPMKGVEVFQKAWFNFQFNDSESNLAVVVEAVRAITADPANLGKVVTLFVDGESVLVGGARSFWDQYPLKGYELWVRFFAALKAEGLGRYFHGMERAYPRWNALAEALPQGKSIGRHYTKWCSWKTQEKIKRRYTSILPGKGKGHTKHFEGALYAVSDYLSVTNAMEMNRKDSLRVFRDKDGVEFRIEMDLTVALIGWRAYESLNGKGTFAAQMAKLRAQAPGLLAKEGGAYGAAEAFIIDLIEKLHARYVALDVG